MFPQPSTSHIVYKPSESPQSSASPRPAISPYPATASPHSSSPSSHVYTGPQLYSSPRSDSVSSHPSCSANSSTASFIVGESPCQNSSSPRSEETEMLPPMLPPLPIVSNRHDLLKDTENCVAFITKKLPDTNVGNLSDLTDHGDAGFSENSSDGAIYTSSNNNADSSYESHLCSNIDESNSNNEEAGTSNRINEDVSDAQLSIDGNEILEDERNSSPDENNSSETSDPSNKSNKK